MAQSKPSSQNVGDDETMEQPGGKVVDSSIAAESSDSLPAVFSDCRTVVSRDFVMFVGVQKIYEVCNNLKLQISYQSRHSSQLVINGALPQLKVFQKRALQFMKKHSSSVAYGVAFGSVCQQHTFELPDAERSNEGRQAFDDGLRTSTSSSLEQDSASLANLVSPVEIFLHTSTVVAERVVVFLGILKLSELCTHYHLQLVADQEHASVRVLGIYSAVNLFGMQIDQLLSSYSASQAYACVFGSNVALIPNSGQTTTATAGAVAASDEDMAFNAKPSSTQMSRGASEHSSDHARCDPVRSEPMQLNTSTFDILAITATEKLKNIEAECRVKIRHDFVPNSSNTQVLLFVEGFRDNCDLARAVQLLRQECMGLIRGVMKEVKISLRSNTDKAAMEQTDWEEMRVKATITDNKCIIYGLQDDVQAAEKKIQNMLRQVHSSSVSAGVGFSFTLERGQMVIVKKGNIIHEKVDVIVNAANSTLDHSGGVAVAICRAAGGSSFQQECTKLVRERGQIQEGRAVYTSAGKLPFKAIVHAVAPRWSSWTTQQKKADTISLLKQACYNSLHATERSGGTSVAIPGLGSGIYGTPKDICARALLDGTQKFFHEKPSSLIRRIVFIDLNDTTVDAFRIEGEQRYRDMSANDTAHAKQGRNRQDKPLLPNSMTSSSSFSDSRNVNNGPDGDNEDVGYCGVCFEEQIVLMTLPCNHRFCKECIDSWARVKPACPTCNRPFGKIEGNQPLGSTMNATYSKFSLPGYDKCGTIMITYNVPSGRQGQEHPHPGRRFVGTTRYAYLPNSEQGKELLHLLERAFNARLVFTVGRSVTTGAEDVVTWNDIHHKTSTNGGPHNYGYPDATYLERLREDLRAKGIE